jgi:outer membrane receptor protein involved in Fe transport
MAAIERTSAMMSVSGLLSRISNRSRTSVLVIGAACLTLLAPDTAVAQVDAGSILGTVRDSSGGIIGGAKVTLKSEDTGITQETTSGASGQYTFDPIKIGHYSVSAESAGFQKLEQPKITVTVQQHVLVDLTLTPGQTTETVVVTSEVPQLQTQDASVGQVVQAQTINALPLNGRNFTFLAQLSAGVTQNQNDGRGMGASGSFAANGLRPTQNNYLLDGIDNNSNLVDFLNGTSYAALPPVDAIEEFRVQTSDYSAELGRGAGAVLNATVKSGSNEFHGNAWEFLRNEKLDAANFFENSGGLTKGPFRQNQFGATFGGPIKRNETFFFMDYQGTRIRQAVTSTYTVPTALERSSGFTDYSELLAQGGTKTDASGQTYALGQIFDPSTTRALGEDYVRTPFAGNIVPANRLDPNAVKLLNLYPAPNQAGLFNNYVTDPKLSNDTDQFDVRGDQTFSDKDSLFSRITYARNPLVQAGPFPGVADGGGYNQNTSSWNGVLSETHTFSPSLINEARIGVNRVTSSREQINGDTLGIPEQYGINGILQAAGNGGLPTLNITGLSALGGSGYLPSIETSNVGQFSETLTKNTGRHNLKAGYTFQRLRFAVLQPAASRGNFYFQGLYTDVPTTTNGNTGIAQFALTPTAASVAGGTDFLGGADYVTASNYANTDSQRNYNAFFFQDDWKVTSKLTLNLGVRWERFGPLVERYGAQSNFQPAAGGGATYLLTQQRCDTPLNPSLVEGAASDGVSFACSLQPGLQTVQNKNFSPRVGFAYLLGQKLVVRGGYGIFYGGFENSSQYNWGSFPFQYNLNFANTVPNGPIQYSNGSYATLETGLSGINLSPSEVTLPISFQGEDFHIPTPYTQSYNFTIQYQLASNDSVQVGYIGNTVRHLPVYINANAPQLILPPSIDSTAYIPFKSFSTFDNYTRYEGNSFYNGLQATYEHRLSYGLTALANYTYSKCRTDALDLLNENNLAYGYRAPTLPGFGVQGDYGLCNYDTKHVFHLSGTYDLPVGHGRQFLGNSNGFVDSVLGGWGTNFILTLQTGQPGTIGCPTSTAAGLACYAFVVPGEDVYAQNRSVNGWLNPAAFASPPAATVIGQSDYSPLGGAPTQYYGPGFHRLDFSVFKSFFFTERTRLEFRSEFFNLTNTPNFANPAFTDFTNPSNFGVINQTRNRQNDQREIQFALKLYF